LLTVYFSIELYRKALDLARRDRLNWYDALIVAAALQSRCKILYTEDLQHGRRFGDLVVENPFL
jgi:predicted nucleic acid-binding protein